MVETKKKTIDEVRRLLREELPGSETRLQYDQQGHVWGIVAAPEFLNLGSSARQDRLWEIFKSKFGRENLEGLGIFLTAHPSELIRESE